MLFIKNLISFFFFLQTRKVKLDYRSPLHVHCLCPYQEGSVFDKYNWSPHTISLPLTQVDWLIYLLHNWSPCILQNSYTVFKNWIVFWRCKSIFFTAVGKQQDLRIYCQFNAFIQDVDWPPRYIIFALLFLHVINLNVLFTMNFNFKYSYSLFYS